MVAAIAPPKVYSTEHTIFNSVMIFYWQLLADRTLKKISKYQTRGDSMMIWERFEMQEKAYEDSRSQRL